MPQLAPLNWLFLMFFFWLMVGFLTIMLWWMKDKKYYIKFSKHNKKMNKKWTW